MLCHISHVLATVVLYETQAAFVDRVAATGEFGTSRENVLRGVLLAHVGDRLRGAGPYVGGTDREVVLETPFPPYGPPRSSATLEPVTGKAIELRRGEVLRIEQLAGGTCVDFNAYNLADHKETLDCGFTRSFQSFAPGPGELIWTNAPRGRPMFAILEMPDTCELDLVGHRCNRVMVELGWGLTEPHPNCQSTLAEAIREYGLTPDDVHDSFNLWMATTIDEQGRRRFRWNPAQKGDRVDLLALFDVLAVPAICGTGDLVGINNYTFGPVGLEVREPTGATLALTEQIEQRWGAMDSQVMPHELAALPVHADRPLRRDPDYRPDYIRLPDTLHLDVELDEHEHALACRLLATGVYGDTEGEVLRAAFMRWSNTHLEQFRRARIAFTDA
jgi:uncharacterized protein YcgI (DUF1989 family)